MRTWKYVATFTIAGMSTMAQAQDSFPVMDWGPMMQTEAMNSAMDDAARQGAGKPQAKQPASRSGGAQSAKTRANCARARGWAADGVATLDFRES